MFADPEGSKRSDETFSTQTYYTLPVVSNTAPLLDRFSALRKIRVEVMRQLEEVRIAGSIGSL